MAITSRVTLKSVFETGDKPGGSNYADWIDSFLHLTDTSSQAISSEVIFNASAKFQTLEATDIAVSGLGAALVSTGRLVVSAASGGAYSIDTLTVSARAQFTNVSADTLNVSAVSANSIWVDRLEAVSATFVSANFTDTFILQDMRIRVTAAIPTAGQHAQGDIAFNSGPDAGGTVGWVNVVAGAPGTWKEFGSIEA